MNENKLSKFLIKGTFFNTIKVIYNKPIASIPLNGEKLTKIQNQIRMPTLTTATRCSPEAFSQSHRQEKEIHIGKEKVKLTLFADYMILYAGTKTLLRLLELMRALIQFQVINLTYKSVEQNTNPRNGPTQ